MQGICLGAVLVEPLQPPLDELANDTSLASSGRQWRLA